MWFDRLWQNTVDLFRSMDIPVRTIECCSGDLADLKVKSYDVEAWSPRQKKYFEVGSCSNLGDAQARRLGIRVKGKDGKYFAHTLNNTVVAPPRMLIAFLENNLNEDGSVIFRLCSSPTWEALPSLCRSTERTDGSAARGTVPGPLWYGAGNPVPVQYEGKEMSCINF